MSTLAHRGTADRKSLSERYEGVKNVLRDQSAQIRLPEFLMFFSLIFYTATPGLGLPLNQVMVIVIVLYGLTRKPVYSLNPVRGLIALFVIMLLYVALVSYNATPTEFAADWTRRFLRLAATTGLIFVLASGQIHFRSAIYGYVTAILVNIPLFYAGIAPDNYPGYLTGYLIDKNVAGMVYCLFGILMVAMVTRRTHKVGFFAIFAVLLWLTGSRTSLGAFAMAFVWILLAPKLPFLGRAFLGSAIYWGIRLLNDDYAQAGAFADRVGSDLLRERIDTAAWERVQQTPFFGQGLGEAYVYFPEQKRDFFFHNSYWSAFVEGGWPWAIFVVAVTVFAMVRPFSKSSRWTPQQVVAQGLGIALLICAWRLGEVLFTLYWAICMGFALRTVLIERAEKDGPMNGIDQHIEHKNTLVS